MIKSRTSLYALALASLLAVYTPRLSVSLSIDELVSAWSIQGSVEQLFERVLGIQNQSPLYFLLLKAWSFFFSSTEQSLRLFSLLVILLTAFGVFLTARELFNRDTGLLASFFFLTLPETVNAGTIARSYCIALVFFVYALHFFIRWLRAARPLNLLLASSCFALSVYGHFFFAAAGLVFLFSFVFLERNAGATLVNILCAASLIAVLLIPVERQIMGIVGRHEILSFAPKPGLGDLFFCVLPLSHCFLLAVGFLSAGFSRPRPEIDRKAISPEKIRFLFSWWLLPPLIVAVVSRGSSLSVLVPRYLSFASIGFSILLACVVSRFRPRQSAAYFLVGFTSLLFLIQFAIHPVDEDWRASVEYARSIPQSKVLSYAGLVESQDIDWLLDARKRQYFLAPFSYYPLEVIQKPLPLRCDTAELREYIRNVILTGVSNEPITLILREMKIDEELSTVHFAKCFSSLGWREVSEQKFGRVAVLRFEKFEAA